MKGVNQKAQRILKILSEGLTEEKPWKTIDNSEGLYIPVTVSFVTKTLFTVAHYYEQNGDFMADPEMMFSKQPKDSFIPVYYKQDNLGIYGRSVEFKNGKITGYRPKMFYSQINFTSDWMRRIKYQQEL